MIEVVETSTLVDTLEKIKQVDIVIQTRYNIMEATIKKIPQHTDKLGRLLKVGDCVAYPDHNSLSIGTVKKLNPKMVKVVRVGAKSIWESSGKDKYPEDLILLEGPAVTVYLLKQT